MLNVTINMFNQKSIALMILLNMCTTYKV